MKNEASAGQFDDDEDDDANSQSKRVRYDEDGNRGENAKKRRLIKNRESARESRSRKKNYMERLEIKCESLTKELDKYKRRVAHLEEQERLNQLSQIDSVAHLLDGRQQLYDRLEDCLE